MPLIKKRDVKNYFAARRHSGIHLHRPASQPDATGFSGEQSGRADSNPSDSLEKTPSQPSSTRLENPPTNSQSDTSHGVRLVQPKNTQK
jgi:hypothetical protein